LEFPYHYGSHATVEPSLSFFSRGKSFHTTMVLTQQNHKYAGKKLTAKFPYHYGSHATNGTNLGRWNSAIQFPYHYGSHATFIEIYNPSHSFYRVSIPLWFSRNSEGTHRTASPILFPYHYGSHATGTLYREEQLVSFPYHYGSHATIGCCLMEKHISQVSIPLWFSRNRFYYKDIIQVLGRQNQPNGKIS